MELGIELKGIGNNFQGTQKKWADMTDDELLAVEGQRDVLVGKIQEKYGKTKQEVEREVDDWGATL